ncbi:hypothetical protein [Paenibacillus harenae]|uniref:hypothetical protein n=1 Tax=Paenibacillus harenae TaxID=306543 RepID=UPI002791F9A4|nr:hypothetical protein [Paenibacillus harenae]MDQ0060021.1 hypothetical protein [Paenibacillus harenae]
MFENFKFKPGIVTYNPYKLSPDDMTDIRCLSEDMFQVEYPNGYLIDVGWYGKFLTLNGVFIIYILKDTKWDKPVFKEEYRSVAELYEGMKSAIERINQSLMLRT